LLTFTNPKTQKNPMKIVSKPRLETVEKNIAILKKVWRELDQIMQNNSLLIEFGDIKLSESVWLRTCLVNGDLQTTIDLLHRFEDSLNGWKVKVAESSDQDRDIMELDYIQFMKQINEMSDKLCRHSIWSNGNPYKLPLNKLVTVNLFDIHQS